MAFVGQVSIQGEILVDRSRSYTYRIFAFSSIPNLGCPRKGHVFKHALHPDTLTRIHNRRFRLPPRFWNGFYGTGFHASGSAQCMHDTDADRFFTWVASLPDIIDPPPPYA